MRGKERLERFYRKKDPWGYESNPDDQRRKKEILSVIPQGVARCPFLRALDIGAGEGWITKDLPAYDIYGYDLSEKAMSRFPEKVIPVKAEDINICFDLIIATGVLYKQYDYKWIIDRINNCADKMVVLCNIKSWERGIELLKGEPTFYKEFPYREYTEVLRVYDYTSASVCRSIRNCDDL